MKETANGSKVVRIVYYTIMPMITAASLFFGIGHKVGKGPIQCEKPENPSAIERIRALEVKQDERYEFIRQQLAEIKNRLDRLSRE